MTENEIMLNNLMNMASELMSCNAEIHRIEDTIKRMGMAYGAQEMNVLAITASVIVTMIMPDGDRITETRRINHPSGFNFDKLIRLNSLSRDYCFKPCSPRELETRIKEISDGTYRRKNDKKYFPMKEHFIDCIGSMLIGGPFAMLFGGTVYDGIACMICSVFCYLIQQVIKRKAPNQLIIQFLNAFVIGIVIEGIANMSPVFHQDKIMIGVIMLLIPGMAMTNALKDILIGETISGALRLIETITWAGALAAGFMVSMTIMGADVLVYYGGEMSMYLNLVLAFVGSFGFAIAFNVPVKYLVPSSIGGSICWAFYLYGMNSLKMSVFTASLFGTMIAAVYAELTARKMKIPAPVMLIPAFIPLVPGGGLYYTMWSAVSQDMTQMRGYAMSTLSCALGMAFGMSLVFAFYDMYIFKKTRK